MFSQLELAIIDFLIKQSAKLFPLFPLSVSDLYEMLCCENIKSDYFNVEKHCLDLARFLPTSFIIQRYQGPFDYKPQFSIVFYDPQVLCLWKTTKDASSDVSRNGQDETSVSDEIPPLVFLLQAITTDKSALADRQKQLKDFVVRPTAVQNVLSSIESSKPPVPYTEICRNSNRSECLKQGNLDCLRKVHFEPIIHPSTDISIGDCSYLDTCYKGKGCKYIHYKILCPETAIQGPCEKTDNAQPFYYSHYHSFSVSLFCIPLSLSRVI